jgi:hypothetical protein
MGEMVSLIFWTIGRVNSILLKPCIVFGQVDFKARESDPIQTVMGSFV